MSKFAGTSTRPQRRNLKGAVRTTDTPTTTHEGAGAYSRTPESDLFVLAVTNMVGEDAFYEAAAQRDDRFRQLIRSVTETNPEFIVGDLEAGRMGFCQYLREEMLMRSATVVMAAEYLAAGGPGARPLIARVLQRPDEPAELLGYWLSTYGRPLPHALRRGVADAARRLYTERNVSRYNGSSATLRMGDVVELMDPTWAQSDAERALFGYLLDDRHHHDAKATEELPVLYAGEQLLSCPTEARRALLRAEPERLAEAGWNWERISSWLPGGMDAEAWSFAIPVMGAMALVRNLRNFDKAGLSEADVDAVIAKITDPEQVSRARLFPYQVWSAYANAPSDNWRRALGKTLDLTTANIPDDLNETLVVVDCSGSMAQPVSGRSTLSRYEVAGVMAAATAVGTKGSDVVIFGETNKRLEIAPGTSALRVVERIRDAVRHREVGVSTFGHTAIRDHFDASRHRRVALFTDDQMWDSDGGDSHAHRYGAHGRPPVNLDHVPLIYTFNLAGYAPSALEAGQKGRYSLGGFSDATFRMLKVLESGKDAGWPF